MAQAALRSRLRDLRELEPQWHEGPNVGWVRWSRGERLWIYCGIRRRFDWITGELGWGTDACDLDQLPLVRRLGSRLHDGCRIALGDLLHGEEKWWSAGGTEAGFGHRLDWIALQLQLRLRTFVTDAESWRDGRPPLS